jgi:hypothetical protein
MASKGGEWSAPERKKKQKPRREVGMSAEASAWNN